MDPNCIFYHGFVNRKQTPFLKEAKFLPILEKTDNVNN